MNRLRVIPNRPDGRLGISESLREAYNAGVGKSNGRCDSMNENETIRYYDEHSESFAARTLDEAVDARMDGLRQDFLAKIPKQGFILDCGCGAGRDTLAFMRAGYPVLPLDGSSEMCRLTTKLTGIKAVQRYFEDIDYENTFDGIWACASLLHVKREKLRDVLKILRRAGKRDCVLHMSFRYGNYNDIRNDRHYTDLTEKDLDWLLADTGWELVKYYVTEDRMQRTDIRWLNVLCQGR